MPAAAVGPDSSFKVVQSLAALGMPIEALNLLRARQSAPRAPQEPDQALREARVSLSIRLSCNLLTEAFMEVNITESCTHPVLEKKLCKCAKCGIASQITWSKQAVKGSSSCHIQECTLECDVAHMDLVSGS